VLKQGEVRQPEFSLYQRHLGTVGQGLGRWRSNPSNPLGVLADNDEQAVVWDEAFYPLATGQWTRGDSESWRVGSLTKLWACAGLRLGYVIAPTDQGADQIRSIQPRWSVNGLALALVNGLLDQTDLPQWSSQITQLGSELANDLAEMGYKARSSAANWVLIENEQDLRNQLIQKRILIRDCTSFGLPGVFRVALPKPGEVDRVLSAFATCSVR
jgi:histidinol-phosphate/aromatic aminotransferase/cobyric acid decarboxylase-like protein